MKTPAFLHSALATALATFGLVTTAVSHTPYLAPNAFEPINDGLITLDASFAEHFFVPEVVFDGSEFSVQLPDGKQVKPDLLQVLKSRVVVEHDMATDGTYRFSTGRRLGRVFKSYEFNGKTVAMENPDEALPAGAKLVAHYQSNTLAETYATRGNPTTTALAPHGDGLELVARSHPNDLFSGDSLQLEAQFFGKPLADLKVEIFLADRHGKDDAPAQTLTSSSDGHLTFTPQQPGVYLMRARHRAKSIAGAAAPETSHTYTLVIEAAE
jgi:hypothetical protein